jgi:putative acetyltransferase
MSSNETQSLPGNIREEHQNDLQAVQALNRAAFEGDGEAKLVAQLHDGNHTILSLVYEHEGDILGHIHFSKGSIETLEGRWPAAALGPMSVRPDHQKQGIGGALIAEGLKRIKDKGVPGVLLLGHPTYYPRFGFMPAYQFGIQSDFYPPQEVFMALELESGGLANRAGLFRYPPPFYSLGLE